MSHLFTSGGQITGASDLASVLPMNIQGWFPLGLTGWISLQSKRLSRVFSNTTIRKHKFFSSQSISSQILTNYKDKKSNLKKKKKRVTLQWRNLVDTTLTTFTSPVWVHVNIMYLLDDTKMTFYFCGIFPITHDPSLTMRKQQTNLIWGTIYKIISYYSSK